ncbi:MAG: hypothetical protein ABIO72_03125 [Patescibacteria group bacterium]
MTLSRLRTLSILAFFLVFGCSIGINEARAFTVSPVLVDIVVDPGKIGSGKIEVTNTDNVRHTYVVSIQKFVAKGEDGQQDFLPESDTTGIADWIVPEARSVSLDPGQHSSFSYTVNVPQNAEPGGHYAALFFSDIPVNAEGTRVGVGAKVGVLFLLRVPGNITETARIEGFRSTADRLSHLPAYFELRIRNVGNVHVHPEGNVTIRNMFGSVVAKIPVNPREASVLPNSVRRLEPAWANTFKEASSGLFTELHNEWRNFGIGRYTAEVQATYGGQGAMLTSTTTFWVIPWQLLIAILLGCILLAILRTGYNRLVLRSAIRRSTRR